MEERSPSGHPAEDEAALTLLRGIPTTPARRKPTDRIIELPGSTQPPAQDGARAIFTPAEDRPRASATFRPARDVVLRGDTPLGNTPPGRVVNGPRRSRLRPSK